MIKALGCQSAMNIPVIEGGVVFGTVNLLDVENHITPTVVAALNWLIRNWQTRLASAMRATPMHG